MDRGGGGGFFFLVFVFGAWALFGTPSRTIAGWFWPEDAAPWETVDAFFYPNSADLSQVKRMPDLDGVPACRDWVQTEATSIGDPGMTRSDYECGIGKPYSMDGFMVYRATVD